MELDKLSIEELRVLVAELNEKNEKQLQELETAKRTTEKLVEKTTKLQELNADLFARTVAGSQDTTIKKEPATVDEIADTIISKLKNKR